eukprot:Skav221576  [mRNA]  locus=scaffold1376:1136980:1140273:- [translate_table: standard]
MHSLELWKEAVASLKPGSARGVDHISATELKMLPWQCLRELVSVMGSYLDGYPSWFMIGVTVPLAKTKDCPNRSQTRPITILPQLYRLWSKVAHGQISAWINRWVPPTVSGLLPNRGANDTAIDTQFMLEVSRSTRCRRTGMCLDLIKCFNNIRISFGFQILRAMGVPLRVLSQWVHSLMRLSRVWTVDFSIHPSCAAYTGFPEGDHWSVLVMVGLALVWATNIARSTPPQAQLAISAYADNWAWSLEGIAFHQQIINDTIFITQAAGVVIDFSKTWYWSQANGDARQLANMLHPICDGTMPVRRETAPDLGLQMQYSGRVSVSLQEQRIQTGMDRLMRIQHSPYDLATKEHLIRVSVYPAMFHGTEIRPPSDATFARIRTKVADALIGHCHAASPIILLSLTSNVILDPEFWVTHRTIIMLKRLLTTYDDDKRKQFFALAARFNGSVANVRGPASALGYLLTKINWQITTQGTIHVTAFESFDFLHISKHRIGRFLTLAWMQDLIKCKTERFHSFAFPDIDRAATTRVLSQFSQPERKLLLRRMAGGFQLESQKSKWLEEQTEDCQFCGQRDSRRHRLLECTLGEHVREPFSDLIAYLHEEESELPEHPFVTVHPMSELYRTVLFQLQMPTPSQDIQDTILSLKQQQHCVHWSTDGSCSFPKIVTARFSAFSVLVDTCKDDGERAQVATSILQGARCASWRPVLTTRTPGEQDILRAELSAIVYVCLFFNWGTIHTDCQAAIDLFRKACEADSFCQLIHLDHLDLLYMLWMRRTEICCRVQKVKAHADLTQVADPLERYWCLGNILADEAAKQACQQLSPELVEGMTKVADDIAATSDALARMLTLELRTMEVRKIAMANARGLEDVPVTREHVVRAFSTWEVEYNIFSIGELDDTFLDACVYGQDVANMTLTWLRQLRWPGHNRGPMEHETGTAWIELALSWMFFNQAFLPVLRASATMDKRVILPGCDRTAKEWTVTFAEVGTMMSNLLDNVIALTPQSLTPALHRRKCKALYLQGCTSHTQGLVGRVQFPCQLEVAETLGALFRTRGKGHLESCPAIGVASGEDTILPLSYAERTRLAKLRMFSCRRKRRNVT